MLHVDSDIRGGPEIATTVYVFKTPGAVCLTSLNTPKQYLNTLIN